MPICYHQYENVKGVKNVLNYIKTMYIVNGEKKEFTRHLDIKVVLMILGLSY